MRVLAGSPRNGGNTTLLIDTIFVELEKYGITTELVQKIKTVDVITSYFTAMSAEMKASFLRTSPYFTEFFK